MDEVGSQTESHSLALDENSDLSDVRSHYRSCDYYRTSQTVDLSAADWQMPIDLRLEQTLMRIASAVDLYKQLVASAAFAFDDTKDSDVDGDDD